MAFEYLWFLEWQVIWKHWIYVIGTPLSDMFWEYYKLKTLPILTRKQISKLKWGSVYIDWFYVVGSLRFSLLFLKSVVFLLAREGKWRHVSVSKRHWRHKNQTRMSYPLILFRRYLNVNVEFFTIVNYSSNGHHLFVDLTG